MVTFNYLFVGTFYYRQYYSTVLYMLHLYKHFCTLIPANLLQKLGCGLYTSQHVVSLWWHAISYDTPDRQMRSLGPTKFSNAGRPVCCLVSHVTNCLVNIKYDSQCQPVHSYCHYTTASPQVFSLGGTAQDCQHNLYASKQNEPWIVHFWRNLLKGK
jgi:hypothetical protein